MLTQPWALPIDEPRCPVGWRTGPPDFVGVGAQRCGTTWWWRAAIATHPQVAIAEGARKEWHFFDPYWRDEAPPDMAARYHRLFPRPNGSITGEWTPRYMHDFWTMPLLKRAAPDARLLVMLRDPVERFRSGIAHSIRLSGAPSDELDLAVVGDSFARGAYYSQLTEVFDLFPRARVLVLQYERCCRDPFTEMQRTQRFLGLDPLRDPPPQLLESDALEKPELPSAVRAALAHRLKDDVARLVELCPEIDRSLWASLVPA